MTCSSVDPKSLAALFRATADLLDPPCPKELTAILMPPSGARIVPRNFSQQGDVPVSVGNHTVPEDMALLLGNFEGTDAAGKPFTIDFATATSEVTGDIESATIDPVAKTMLVVPVDDGVLGGTGTAVFKAGNASYIANITLDSATLSDINAAGVTATVVPRPAGP